MTKLESHLPSGSIVDGKYKLLEAVGAGGMGEVYLAEQLAIGRKVALKRLRPELAVETENIERFHREARAAGSIGHDNICEVTDLGSDSDGAPYLVMPFLKGCSFGALLKKQSISIYRVIDIVGQALDALEAAHQAGIVHRDLKPDNVFITRYGDREDFVKLLDFGISKIIEGSDLAARLTQTGTIMGTPAYMSPEQARGDLKLSRKVDIYSVGVMLYEATTALLPFEGASYNAVMYQILTAAFPPPSAVNPSVPVSIERVILKSMSRDPEERYSTAAEMKDAVVGALSDLSMGDVNFVTGHFSTEDRDAGMTPTNVDCQQTPMATTMTGSITSASPRSPSRKWLLGAGAVLAAATFAFFLGGLGAEEPASPPRPAVIPAAPQVEATLPSQPPSKDTDGEATKPLEFKKADATDPAPKDEIEPKPKPQPTRKVRIVRKKRPTVKKPVKPATPKAKPKAQIDGRFGTNVVTSYDD